MRALALGPGQRQARLLEQLLRVARVRRGQRDTDVRAHVGRLAEQVERLLQDRQQALAQPRRTRRRLDVGLDDRELVRPHAGQRVGLAQGGEQARAHVAQQKVARGIAERVVDRLEVGQIQAKHRRHPVAAPPAGQRRVQPLEEDAAVRQAGQRIVAHQVVDLLLRGAQGVLLPIPRPGQRLAEPGAERGTPDREHRQQPGEQCQRRNRARRRTGHASRAGIPAPRSRDRSRAEPHRP